MTESEHTASRLYMCVCELIVTTFYDFQGLPPILQSIIVQAGRLSGDVGTWTWSRLSLDTIGISSYLGSGTGLLRMFPFFSTST